MNLNATLIAQLVVFFILVVFTMKFVWPPIVKALDERAEKVANGLAAADKAKADLAHAEKKVVEEMRKARESAGDVRASAEKQASQLVDEARAEAARIIADGRAAMDHETRARADQRLHAPGCRIEIRVKLIRPLVLPVGEKTELRQRSCVGIRQDGAPVQVQKHFFD